MNELQRKQGKEMEERELDMKVFVEQMALLVDLKLRDEYKDGVVANFERICNIAKVVLEFDLPENVEAAPVFEPLDRHVNQRFSRNPLVFPEG